MPMIINSIAIVYHFNAMNIMVNSHRGAEEQAALRPARLGAPEPRASGRYAQLFGLQGGPGREKSLEFLAWFYGDF